MRWRSRARTASSLLAVFAHPDDESIASGGLLARCGSDTVGASLLCLTRGGLGQVDDPARARMGELRERELAAATRILGVREVIVLDHRNGFLPWADRNVLEADIVSVIRRVRPAIVVTFDDDGLYWHPDHIVVHERTTAAVSALAEEAPALYYVQVPKGAMRNAWLAATRAAEARGDLETVRPFALGVEVDAFGLFTTPPTLTLDVSGAGGRQVARRFVPTRRSCSATRSIGCRRSARADVLGVELYRRAAVGAQEETFLDRIARPI